MSFWSGVSVFGNFAPSLGLGSNAAGPSRPSLRPLTGRYWRQLPFRRGRVPCQFCPGHLSPDITENGGGAQPLCGTVTAGDTLTITVHNTALSGGTEPVAYTVL